MLVRCIRERAILAQFSLQTEKIALSPPSARNLDRPSSCCLPLPCPLSDVRIARASEGQTQRHAL